MKMKRSSPHLKEMMKMMKMMRRKASNARAAQTPSLREKPWSRQRRSDLTLAQLSCRPVSWLPASRGKTLSSSWSTIPRWSRSRMLKWRSRGQGHLGMLALVHSLTMTGWTNACWHSIRICRSCVRSPKTHPRPEIERWSRDKRRSLKGLLPLSTLRRRKWTCEPWFLGWCAGEPDLLEHG